MPTVAAKNLILDGYVRVSQVRGREGESFISPDVQRDQIEAWCRMRGATIAAWHTDLDQSGAKSDRPGLTAAVSRVESGETGGIVVAKLDRFARSLVSALDAIQRVHTAGGIVVSVAEGVDPSTPAGKMMMRLLLVFAEWELDRVREMWRMSRERAVARGVHIASRTPTGYKRDNGGRLVPNADAPTIRRLFEQRAAGKSWRGLQLLLQASGATSPYGSPHWTPGAAEKIISNRVYLGEARSGEFVNADAHKALVSREAWNSAQSARGVSSPRGEPALLSGLVRCAGCRHSLKPDKTTLRSGDRVRSYRCRGNHAAGQCEARATVLGSVIEPWVEERFLAWAGKLAAESSEQADDLAELEQQVRDVEVELAAFRDDERIVGALGSDLFVEGLRKRADAVEQAHGELAEHRVRQQPTAISLAEVGNVWPTLNIAERRALLVASIDCIFLRNVRQANVPIAERAIIFWRGQAPDGLPRRGRRVPLRPFDWPSDPPA